MFGLKERPTGMADGQVPPGTAADPATKETTAARAVPAQAEKDDGYYATKGGVFAAMIDAIDVAALAGID